MSTDDCGGYGAWSADCKFCNVIGTVTILNEPPGTKLAKCNMCKKIGTYILPTMHPDRVCGILEDMHDSDKVLLLRHACEKGLEEIEHYGWWHETQEIIRNALELTK